ncbi:hypothetical protein AbraIFM66950_011651 [Aspergillus brasiliensis]|nr:hypothetical protein AbraIFM66950_011651 [Aspergillus brasiliensis]
MVSAPLTGVPDASLALSPTRLKINFSACYLATLYSSLGHLNDTSQDYHYVEGQSIKMARKKWPVLPDTSGQHVPQAARRLIDHCQAMESHARNSPQLNLHAPAVEQFAKLVKKVISDLLDDCMRSGEICNQLSNLYQSLPQALNEYQEAKTEALPTSGAAPIANPDEIPNQSSPSLSESSATDNSEVEWPTLDPRYDPDNDKRIRIHWNETTPPYRDEPLSRLISEVQDVVYEEGLNVQISRAQKLPSGDIDI